MEELLGVWDFMCHFHQVLGCLPVPFHQFLQSITHEGTRQAWGDGATATPLDAPNYDQDLQIEKVR